ncbi:MAG TPA: hypothetical protein VFE24_17140 [Pirellulales bacterium]|jgi:tetratricopeptide (TPR) repeat protein|nr:hypothetical protein [Pirellulales bacterium]
MKRCAILAWMIVVGWTHLALAASGPQTLFLAITRGWEMHVKDHRYRGPLSRELVRQALFLAAHEELGLDVRDALLGETMPAEGDNEPFEVAVAPGKNRLELLRGFGTRQASIWHADFDFSGNKLSYPELVSASEKLARTEWVAVLKQSGFAGADRHPGSKRTRQMPEAVETLLNDLTFSAQFDAVRRLHVALEQDRDSPVLLGGLIRGYAQLGLLTEPYFCSLHSVFTARALLYAQRWVVQANADTESLRHLAFAEALAGLHGIALDDLDRADRAAAGRTSAPPVAPWVEWIRSFCRIDQLALAPQRAGPQNLPALLRFLALEHEGDGAQLRLFGPDILKQIPECYRLYPGVEGQGIFRERLYARMLSIAGLPNSVEEFVKTSGEAAAAVNANAAILAEFDRRATLISKLCNAAESERSRLKSTAASPLSWVALAQMIRQISFLQTFRQAALNFSVAGNNVDELLDATVPLFEQNPLMPVLGMFVSNEKDRAFALANMTKKFDWYQLDIHDEPLFWPLRLTVSDLGGSLLDYLDSLRDDVANDWLISRGDQFPPSTEQAHRLLDVSPFSPKAMAQLLRYDWGWAKSHVADWEKLSAGHPSLALTLGLQLERAKEFAKAERQFKIAIELEFSAPGYLGLAECYQQQGDLDRWRATLNKFIDKTRDPEIRALAQGRFIEHYILERDWKKALPYVAIVENTHNVPARYMSAVVYEHSANWGKAEPLFQALSNEPGVSPDELFCFYQRTGQGDLASRRAAESLVDDAKDRMSISKLVAYNQLCGNSKRALEIAEAALHGLPSPELGLLAALSAEDLKDQSRRDKALDFIANHAANYQPQSNTEPASELISLSKLWIADLAKGGKAEFDWSELDKIGAHCAPEAKDEFYYFVGAYLDRHGKPEKAIDYWKMVMFSRVMPGYPQTLAGAALLKHKIGPEKLAAEEQQAKSAKSKPDAKPAAQK